MTKNCWMHQMTTLLGWLWLMSNAGIAGWGMGMWWAIFSPDDDNDWGVINDFDIRTLTNLIVRLLADGWFVQVLLEDQPAKPEDHHLNQHNNRPLTCIIRKTGNWSYPKSKPNDKTCWCQQSCFICHHHLVKTINTQWMCVQWTWLCASWVTLTRN